MATAPHNVPQPSRMMAASAVPAAPPPSRSGLRRLLRLISRSCLIWRCAAVQLVKVAMVKRRYKKRSARDPELIAARRKLAGELRDTLIRLGPTFIKVAPSDAVDVVR